MSETLESPQAVEDEFARWLPRHNRSAGEARALLRDFLAGGAPEGGPCAVAAELVVSELVANAVQHGRPDGGQFGELILLRLERRAERLLIEVHDANAAAPTVRSADPQDESGRGLWLVEQLALAWGFGRRDGIGKRVWATVGPAHRGVG
ncbi:ATP-binding protein [Kitasatospora viridis]|uniref:Histidine kinase-like protein n=1 Tax=Kitasatospora viridis TaxID=281105 RepID=A0A561UB05_9ACTN|nr:ATP-binding protein [Kitasatospora viridis]TWF96542.1 histidine kinase-like protein [Kitasatospora viridis]